MGNYYLRQSISCKMVNFIGQDMSGIMHQIPHYEKPGISSHFCLSLLQMPVPAHSSVCLVFVSLFLLNYIVIWFAKQPIPSFPDSNYYEWLPQIMAKLKDGTKGPPQWHLKSWPLKNVVNEEILKPSFKSWCLVLPYCDRQL